MYDYKENNKVTLAGKVVTEPTVHHEVYDEKFIAFDIEVERLSDSNDIIPILISEKIANDVRINDCIKFEGQIRTYNKIEKGRKRLLVFAFPKSIDIISPEELANIKNPNEVELVGYICKPTSYRETPLKREICDILMAVNRNYNKSDYIPGVAWGRNAVYSSKLEVGTRVKTIGRLQSRTYTKKNGDEISTNTAYEISYSRVTVIQEEK